MNTFGAATLESERGHHKMMLRTTAGADHSDPLVPLRAKDIYGKHVR